ncbi:hypothetical protein ACG9XW_08395 [Acinetobacter guillouiae]|uniref:hypothetical protein n=1 Tax=Acinetobacter guillouiae TaxID=106649 RepID=UPI003AF6E9DD
MPEEKKIEQKVLQFKANPFEISVKTETSDLRKFNGIAYSGEPIQGHYYWGDVIFDLDSMQVDTPLAALLDHDTGRRVGVVTQFTKDNTSGLKVSGDLLTNAYGQQVASDSDEGFPWQMSVYIDPASIEEVERGQVVVNGRTLNAPITIFRGGRIREVSFCALGADDNTSAVAASHQSKLNQFQQEDTNVSELEQEKAARFKAEQERDQAQTELKKFKAEKRTEDIAALQIELNTQFSADDTKSYTDMDDVAFSFMAKQLRQFSSKQPPAGQQQPIPAVNPALQHLFNHQATGGQGGTPNQDQPHKFTSGAQAFAGQNKGA